MVGISILEDSLLSALGGYGMREEQKEKREKGWQISPERKNCRSPGDRCNWDAGRRIGFHNGP